MGRTRALTWVALAAALLASACRAAPAASSRGATAAADVSAATSTALPGGIAPKELAVTVTDASYGAVSALTVAGATCSGLLRVDGGHFGDAPLGTLPSVTASTAGIARWAYATPRVPKGTATYSVTCTSASTTGTATGSFDIDLAPLQPTSLKVRVAIDAPAEVVLNPDPSLVPLRDAVVAKMKATLATEWRNATRGLGALQVVDASQDITLRVVAARGTSKHRSSSDGSQDIIVFVSDTFGPESVENSVATALHELGHIWCCYGPGTYPSDSEQYGHWLTNQRSAGLYGVDKYGLMTDPVTCLIYGAVVSCPNRFSDREMTALGFASFPPATVDACVSQALSLKASLASLNTQLDAIDAQIRAQEASLASIRSQLQALDARYPTGMPTALVAQYNSLVAQYNTLAAQNRASVDSYNATVAQAQTQTAQINSLPCDAS